jgi:hypothetical protein
VDLGYRGSILIGNNHRCTLLLSQYLRLKEYLLITFRNGARLKHILVMNFKIWVVYSRIDGLHDCILVRIQMIC